MKKIFLCYDIAYDKLLRNYINAKEMAGDSPYTVAGVSSTKTSLVAKWEKETRKKIEGAEVVLVMVGEHTYKEPQVAEEIAIAKEYGKPVIQMIGRNDRGIDECPSVADAGELYLWNWNKLKELLS